MAPKKGVARVVKPKDKPRKPTQTAAATQASKTGGDLHILWLCFKNSGSGQVNYQAVADAVGITKSAAKQRFYKVKNYFEGAQPAGKNDRGEGMKAEDQPEAEEWESNSEDSRGDQEMKMEDDGEAEEG